VRGDALDGQVNFDEAFGIRMIHEIDNPLYLARFAEKQFLLLGWLRIGSAESDFL
jgi:hypothetical protein